MKNTKANAKRFMVQYERRLGTVSLMVAYADKYAKSVLPPQAKRAAPKIERNLHLRRYGTFRWGIYYTGSNRVLGVQYRKPQALKLAKELAKQRKCTLYVHKEDNTIQKTIPYGNT